MRENDLLLWMSARHEGSWQQFRAAVEELREAERTEESSAWPPENGEFPFYQQMRFNLQRLAHVEFFAHGCEDGWRVTPPTLAASRTEGHFMGILCGARSDALRGRFEEAARNVTLEAQKAPDAPDIIRVFSSEEGCLVRLAEQIGVRFQGEAPLAILLNLPTATPPSACAPAAEFPLGAGWSAQEFSVEQLHWNAVERSEANARRTGFFRFSIHFQRDRFFLRWDGHTHEPHRAIGIYALLRRRRRKVLRYDHATRALTLPAICRPPMLLERALVLCHGLPPTFDPSNSSLTYACVPQGIANIAAQLLRQDFR